MTSFLDACTHSLLSCLSISLSHTHTHRYNHTTTGLKSTCLQGPLLMDCQQKMRRLHGCWIFTLTNAAAALPNLQICAVNPAARGKTLTLCVGQISNETRETQVCRFSKKGGLQQPFQIITHTFSNTHTHTRCNLYETKHGKLIQCEL